MHCLDEIDYLARDSGPPRWSATTLPAPEQSKAATMPSDDRLGFDDQQGLTPARPTPQQDCPEPAIRCAQYHATTAMLAPQHEYLVAKCEQLDF
jgi:hypothetical protein